MQNCLISLFDYSGNFSLPYRRAGISVVQIDIQLGINILTWDYKSWYYLHRPKQIGIMAAIPCTEYAVSGRRWFAGKDADGRTAHSEMLVAKTKEIIDYFAALSILRFWVIENPISRIHKLNPWMGEIKLKFHPYQFAGYDIIESNSRYNKMTWLWGQFDLPVPKPLPPLQKKYPAHTKLGGRSLKTKNIRSKTPLGFAFAFFAANDFTSQCPK